MLSFVYFLLVGGYLQVPKKMKQPIYVYYQLENFYQNHRRYSMELL